MYTEADCPDCIHLITNPLKKLLNTEGMLQLVNLKLVPYGNAIRNAENNQIQCQHGQNECIANLHESCVNKHLADQNLTNLKFIVCLEEKIKANKRVFNEQFMGECGSELSVQQQQMDLISSCSSSPEGIEEFLQMAYKTEGLVPNNEYVPWIVVDGVHDENIEDEVIDDMVAFVCKKYSGDLKVDACNQFVQTNQSFLSLQKKGKQ